MQVLASGKNGSNKYALRVDDPNKVFTRIDARQLAQNSQNGYEETQGFSLSGNEGSLEAIVPNLSIIDVSNINTYSKSLSKMIQTYVANASRLDVDGASTPNAIILQRPNISQNELDPNSTNNSKTASLPFKFKDDLRFTFRATSSNSGAMTVQIPELADLVGAVDIVDEQENDLAGGEIFINKYYTIVAKTISTVKKFILIGTSSSSGGLVGGLVPYASNIVPVGHLECDGSAISRVTYSSLFSVIGTLWGVGDGLTTFNIPDLRGEFIRGWDNGKGTDSGRTFASNQNYAIENIIGTFGYYNSLAGTSYSGAFYQAGNVNTADSNNGGTQAYLTGFDASTVVNTSTETRPRNIALMYCIKY
jgi:microcystin-dependent protein